MKRFSLIAVVLLIVVMVSAQQDEKAKNILDQVSRETRSFKAFSADFAFTMQNKEMDIHERNEGTIKIKDQKYRIELPGAGITVFSDGSTLWNYMKEGNQVTISNIDNESNELMNPSSIFSIYEKGFKSKFVSETKVGTEVIYNIDLFPDNINKQEVSKVSISIYKETMMIYSATLYGTDGNLYGIEVKKMEPNRDFPDSDFVFNAGKYTDVEIIDFR